jgi:hypothetical protein
MHFLLTLHCTALERLLSGPKPAVSSESIRQARRQAIVVAERGDLFPGILESSRKGLGSP